MISQAQVHQALMPWLGSPLLNALEPLTGEITGQLNGCSIQRNADTLAEELDSLLFRAVRSATEGSMLAQLPDDTFVRVQVQDFATMADDLMLLIFQDSAPCQPVGPAGALYALWRAAKPPGAGGHRVGG